MTPDANPNLSDALADIATIRRCIDRGRLFRGYRAGTVASTGLVAIVVAAAQPFVVADPVKHAGLYLALWSTVAVVACAYFAAEMAVRCRRLSSAVQTERTLEAAERFLPCLAAGALLTVVVYLYAQRIVWVLPGLWAMFFALGIFASRPLLPRGIGVVAGFYLIAGSVAIAFGQGGQGGQGGSGGFGIAALSPWWMGGTFGFGQLLAAGVLYWNFERQGGRPLGR